MSPDRMIFLIFHNVPTFSEYLITENIDKIELIEHNIMQTFETN